MSEKNRDIETLLREYHEGRLSQEETRILFSLLDDSSANEFLDGISPALQPGQVRYPHKSRLLKSYSNLSDDQFEILCIALAEGDLTYEQEEEIRSIAGNNPLRAETLSLYEKLRLTPDKTVFPGKNRLKRVSPSGRIIRLTSATITIAASVAIAVTILGPRHPGMEISPTTAVNEDQNIRNNSLSGPVSAVAVNDNPLKALNKDPGNTSPAIAINTTGREVITELAETINESEAVLSRIEFAPVTGSPVNAVVSSIPNDIGLADIYLAEAGEYHGSLSLKDHLEIAFREKILGETIADASPLKGHEIASAGITGLNKLLGWEMNLAVDEKNQGDINSVVFSSRLINFHTPARNQEDPR